MVCHDVTIRITLNQGDSRMSRVRVVKREKQRARKKERRRIREQGEMEKMFYSIDILSQKVGRVNILLGWEQNHAHSSGYNRFPYPFP